MNKLVQIFLIYIMLSTRLKILATQLFNSKFHCFRVRFSATWGGDLAKSLLRYTKLTNHDLRNWKYYDE